MNDSEALRSAAAAGAAETEDLANERATEFSPRDELDRILRQWWLIALFTIWGGLVGWLIFQTRTPVYEAEAVFTISIDFTQTGELTQFEEDHAVSGILTILYSTPVLDQVLVEAHNQGIPVDLPGLLSQSSFERKQSRWMLRVRDRDPQRAATLANLWADATLTALQEAHRNALTAQARQAYLVFLQGCLAPATPGTGTEGVACSELDPAELPEEIDQTARELQQELADSQGIFPALVFDLAQRAHIPTEPVRYGLNSMIFAGAMIGFLLGAWAVSADLAGRISRWRQHG